MAEACGLEVEPEMLQLYLYSTDKSEESPKSLLAIAHQLLTWQGTIGPCALLPSYSAIRIQALPGCALNSALTP
jgi:hypothetical protein